MEAMKTSNRATRSASSRAASRTLVTAIIALAAVFTSVGIAQAGQSGPGIWVYNTTWSLNVFNLTNYNLKKIEPADNPTHEAGGCEPGGTGNYPFQSLGSLGPYRSYQETLGHGCNLAPLHYYGCTVFEVQDPDPAGLKNWKFKVCFDAQKADGLLEMGTWISLRKYADTQDWSPANTTAYGRWATPINESPAKMHNIMTLIGPKMMATVYSTNNKGIVVMVQQYWENAPGWDDSSNYHALPLDFVDNASSSVPGQ
jgi:hypothetical protein